MLAPAKKKNQTHEIAILQLKAKDMTIWIIIVRFLKATLKEYSSYICIYIFSFQSITRAVKIDDKIKSFQFYQVIYSL